MIPTEPTFNIEEKSDTQVVLRVEIPAEAMQQALEATYDRYAQGARVPGFRKGRVPREYLESRFGAEEFTAETQDDVHERYARRALKDLDLRPVASPRLTPGAWQPGQPYTFRLAVPTFAEIVVPELHGLEIEVPAIPAVGESDIEDALQSLRWRFATLHEKPATEPVAADDVARLGRGEASSQLRVDPATPLGADLIGRHVGEEIAVPGSDPNDDATPPLRLLAVHSATLPEADDELARIAGYDSLDALREHLDGALRRHREERALDAKRGALVERLLDAAEFPLPELLLDEIVEREIAELRDRLAEERPPASLEDALAERNEDEASLRVSLRGTATRRLRRDLLLGKVLEESGVSLDDAALETRASEVAKAEGENPMKYIARLKAEERWEDYRRAEATADALDRLLEQVTVREKETE